MHRYTDHFSPGLDRRTYLASKNRFTRAFCVDSSGRWLFEVYPHPAMVRLFTLDTIIKYKKGTPADKRAGLASLRQHLQNLANESRGLVQSPTLIELVGRDLTGFTGEALKRHEDTLDAIFCAYLAWHCWRWGAERNDMFGTLEDGYIVVPEAVVNEVYPTRPT
jgi:predicted RNase H-like nuclease